MGILFDIVVFWWYDRWNIIKFLNNGGNGYVGNKARERGGFAA